MSRAAATFRWANGAVEMREVTTQYGDLPVDTVVIVRSINRKYRVLFSKGSDGSYKQVTHRDITPCLLRRRS